MKSVIAYDPGSGNQKVKFDGRVAVIQTAVRRLIADARGAPLPPRVITALRELLEAINDDTARRILEKLDKP
jgi:hypothetical protein